MTREDRRYVRAKSEDFVKSIVEISQRKEEPAKPEEGVKDVKKIEDLTKLVKEKGADKFRDYWEKKDKKLEKKLQK